MSSYFKQTFVKYPKDKIVIHHTAGSGNPFAVCDWWTSQDKNISTCKVIGGIGNQNKWDGICVDFFAAKYYAYHLGIKENDYSISKSSIGIEICSYGGLAYQNGVYTNYVHGIITQDQVCKLDKTFRGFDFFQAYTEKQIATLKAQLIQLSQQFNIDLHSGMYALLKKNGKAFEIQTSALSGKPGLWTHVNYRRDKIDCYPDPKLIQMILEL